MSNSMIRFKGFEFEHNPETLKITTENNVRYQRIVNGKDILCGHCVVDSIRRS